MLGEHLWATASGNPPRGRKGSVDVYWWTKLAPAAAAAVGARPGRLAGGGGRVRVVPLLFRGLPMLQRAALRSTFLLPQAVGQLSDFFFPVHFRTLSHRGKHDASLAPPSGRTGRP